MKKLNKIAKNKILSVSYNIVAGFILFLLAICSCAMLAVFFVYLFELSYNVNSITFDIAKLGAFMWTTIIINYVITFIIYVRNNLE